MSRVLNDLRFGLRVLAGSPGFTAVALLTVALGVGANSAIFSAVHATLLRPLPFDRADELAMVWMDNTRLGIREDITSYPSFTDWREGNVAFIDLAAFQRGFANVTGEFEPERVPAAEVMANFFPLLGVEPVLGRSFTLEEEEPGREFVAVLSNALWQRRFAGDPAVLGTTIRLDGDEYTVVGVAPAGFAFPFDSQLWTPLAVSPEMKEERFAFWLYAVGRLRPDVGIEEAQAEMSGIAARLAAEFPDLAGYGVYLEPMRRHLVGEVGPALLLLSGVVGFVLLIACANVANLLLARAASREREMALRGALGAGRRRLLGQLLTEAAMLALAGGALGLGLAQAGLALMRRLGPADLPQLAEAGLDLPVLAFTLGVSLATGLLFGALPARQASRPQLAEALKEAGRTLAGGRRGRRVRQALVVAEVALAVVLLVGAGLLLRSFARLQQVDAGFDARGVLSVELALSGPAYEEAEAVRSFYRELRRRVAVLPGVESVAAGSDVLLPKLARSATFTVEGRPNPPPEERIEVPIDAVTPGFFQTLRIPLLAGRDLAESYPEDAPPEAIVNHAMARRFWPGEEAVGKRFKFGDEDSESRWRTVVGVVGDARRTSLEQEARPSTWLAHVQAPMSSMTLVVRTAGDPANLAPAVRRTVREVDPDQPITRIETLEAQLGERLAERRLNTLLWGLFAGLALFLAAVGVYGVISYSVSQSTSEIGVRMALGAKGGDVVGLVLRQAMALVLLGLGLGLAGAWAASRALARFLYGVTATDLATFAAIPLLLAAAAALAAYLPARRAARTDPGTALRSE